MQFYEEYANKQTNKCINMFRMHVNLILGALIERSTRVQTRVKKVFSHQDALKLLK